MVNRFFLCKTKGAAIVVCIRVGRVENGVSAFRLQDQKSWKDIQLFLDGGNFCLASSTFKMSKAESGSRVETSEISNRSFCFF
jgi:hypothetical protein